MQNYIHSKNTTDFILQYIPSNIYNVLLSREISFFYERLRSIIETTKALTGQNPEAAETNPDLYILFL
jgi:hypothetical protein